ncbi:hypothetical protein KM043_000391 [Ampulex compressa]|nr:hypothetical protein KM043_000391 [Ampulex compressa]
MSRWIFLAAFASVAVARVRNGLLYEAESNSISRDDDRTVCRTKDCMDFAEIILSSMNESVDPCVDFYEYTCGNWSRNYPIPDDKITLNAKLFMEARIQRQMEEVFLADPEPEDVSPVRLLKKWYRACVDTDGMEKRGLEPVVSVLSGIGGWPLISNGANCEKNNYTWQDVDEYYARLTGSNRLHDLRVAAYGSKDAELGIVIDVPQLPEGMWILNEELAEDPEEFAENTTGAVADSASVTGGDVKINRGGRYWKIVEKVATAVAGAAGYHVPQGILADDIDDMLRFQWKLDKLTYLMDQYQNVTLDSFQKAYDSRARTDNSKVNWSKKIIDSFGRANVQIDKDVKAKVVSPEYFERLVSLLDETSAATIVNYVHWSFISRALASTSSEMRSLYDTPAADDEAPANKRSTRWEQCIEGEDMRYVVAYEYTRRYFPDYYIDIAKHMLSDIQKEVELQIVGSNWADEAVKDLFLKKFWKIKQNIGYPEWFKNRTLVDHFLDGLTVESTYFENKIHRQRYLIQKSLRSLIEKQPVELWLTDPGTVNAFYLLADNSITILAATFDKPMFSSKRPNTVNYALLGFLSGHELIHPFDEKRRMYDENGSAVEWSTPMMKSYNKSLECFIEQYNNYPLDANSTKVEGYGQQTLDENIADTNGLQAAFHAYHRRERLNGKIADVLPGLERFSNDQIFFLSFSNLWCEATKSKNPIFDAQQNLHRNLLDPPQRIILNGI